MANKDIRRIGDPATGGASEQEESLWPILETQFLNLETQDRQAKLLGGAQSQHDHCLASLSPSYT